MKSLLLKLVTGVITIVALVLLMTGNAAASNTYDWSAFAGTGLGPGYAQADWETNSNPTLVMQVRVQCHPFAGGNEYYNYSGNVKGLEIDDMATCNFAGIADKGQIHFKCDHSGCSWGSWHTFWTRCCSPFRSAIPANIKARINH